MDARELYEQGYYPISNRYRMAARIDRPDWREHMPKIQDSYAGEWYCRCVSKDALEAIPITYYRKLKGLWGNRAPAYVNKEPQP